MTGINIHYDPRQFLKIHYRNGCEYEYFIRWMDYNGRLTRIIVPFDAGHYYLKKFEVVLQTQCYPESR
jgi:hypothetical protein